MCAIGKILIILSPLRTFSPKTPIAKSKLLHKARAGIITPLEKPVVPLV